MAEHKIKLGKGLENTTDLGCKNLFVEDDRKIQSGVYPNFTEISIVELNFDNDYMFFLSEEDALALSFKLFDIVEARKKARGET